MIDELGTLSESADGWTLHFTRQLEQPPAAVWRAFAEPELVEQWFPTTIEGELRTGAPLRFGFKGHDVEPMAGEVLEAAAPHLLVFTWGPDTLRFEMSDCDGGTRLSLSVLLEAQGKAARDGAGWHECLGRVAGALAGSRDGATGATGAGGDTWGDVHPAYVATFGPDAATIGPPPGVQTG